MQYIRRENGEIIVGDYLAYLEEIAPDLPASARHFALLPYRYQQTDRRCPHDSWVDSVSIQELPEGDRKQRRPIEIKARFLGSYHDGYFTITYIGVMDYCLSASPFSNRKSALGHGDWIVDELLLVSPGIISHEIEFSLGNWKIICGDIQYEWHQIQ